MAPLSNIGKRVFQCCFLQRNGPLCYRLVSTSGRKEEAADKACDGQQAVYRKVPDFTKPLENKNWVSFGFDDHDEARDKFRMHIAFFMYISVLICGGAVFFTYYPDRGRKDWARREAFIRLHEREQLGLEPIDPNYIDPSKIILPPDEELSEEDIVV